MPFFELKKRRWEFELWDVRLRGEVDIVECLQRWEMGGRDSTLDAMFVTTLDFGAYHVGEVDDGIPSILTWVRSRESEPLHS